MNEHLRQRIGEYLRPIRLSEQERKLIIAVVEVAYESGRRDGLKEAINDEATFRARRRKDDVEEGTGGKH